MMKTIDIKEHAGIPRTGEYVRVAVPCARGEFPSGTSFNLIAPGGEFQACQAKVLKAWPDDSAKWLLVDFAASAPAGESAAYRLAPANGETAKAEAPIRVTQEGKTWKVNTGVGVFVIDAQILRPFSSVRWQGRELMHAQGSVCRLSEDGVHALSSEVEKVSLEDEGPLRSILHLEGRFKTKTGPKPRFGCRIHFFAGSMAVQMEFTLHNPEAARHPGGLWDLGDSGSFFFKELSFGFPLENAADKEAICIPELGGDPMKAEGGARLSIYQEASGGKNWRSPVHRNRGGRIPFDRQGYVLERGGQEIITGLRATPQVWCGNREIGVSAVVPYFWQEFPSEMGVEGAEVRVSPFPARFSDLHELQGGEQKTTTMVLDFASEPQGLAGFLSPLQAMASPQDYRTSGILFDLPGEKGLVDEITTSAKILAKREVLDEYGWRNFGEIYADHEAVFHQGEKLLVSHYNNQYDFIAGAYRKYFTTGDEDWGRIASELAGHVRDIDLYHTDRDREEYNHGLFWHTDHYTAAGLSTHRSYSREQEGAYELHAGGGGPNPEHCYTTGLMLHYFQTGNPAYKGAVIQMADWVLRASNGPTTVLGALKGGVSYLNQWRNARGDRRLFPRLPLNRGTGNAIVACLDAFEVGGGRRYLASAEDLIRKTIHPEDDLRGRDLLNAEAAWSYTVFLVSVVKFLDKKVELEEYDEGFSYARASLLVYARWMAANEYPYLEKPEILEYPNETWAAQDLRKSVVFYQAARYAETEKEREGFLERARFFYSYASQEIPKHPSSRFARPVALVLQNGWIGERLEKDAHLTSFEMGEMKRSQKAVVSGRPTPYLNAASVACRLGTEFFQALIRLNIRKELAWLRARLQS